MSSISGEGYGDGNLGTKGMALFFHSHQCNDICKSLKLTRFDLTKMEKQDLSRQSSGTTSSMTSVKGQELQCGSPGGVEHVGADFAPFFRARSNSGFGLEDTRPHSRTRTFSDYYSMEESPPSSAVSILSLFPKRYSDRGRSILRWTQTHSSGPLQN